MGGVLQILWQGLIITALSLILFFSLDVDYMEEVDLFHFLYDFTVHFSRVKRKTVSFLPSKIVIVYLVL